jgi:hypothetical protein
VESNAAAQSQSVAVALLEHFPSLGESGMISAPSPYVTSVEDCARHVSERSRRDVHRIEIQLLPENRGGRSIRRHSAGSVNPSS